MADNTATAREKLRGQRAAVREHVRKWRDYKEQYEKDGAWKTIQNAQSHITRLKADHPSLNMREPEDDWRPGSNIPW